MAKRKRQKVNMPMSGAGLIRYMDEEGKGLKFKPEQIIYAAAALVVVEILVKLGFI
ncbi:MAG TPA: preprotein translocase subunit Sec61beta [Euryarchaeota archaeon]|nr:preprotein translocase subunit Sec61beta [Euryarchaeota archaeon]